MHQAVTTPRLPDLREILGSVPEPGRTALRRLRRQALDWLLELRTCPRCRHRQFVGAALLAWSRQQRGAAAEVGLDCEGCGASLLRHPVAEIRRSRPLP